MLFDWVTAIIIIFTLHYLISFTLTVTQAVTDVFNVKIVGENGEDVIFSKLRTEIGNTENFGDMLLKVVMYYALIVLTIKFTIQYFKRTVYVAFLTMIAPLIGLTYPLDKIKDGQAQAFSMWIKEFLFNALIQPFQLILYYVFVGTAVMSEFAVENPIFALVVLSFMGPAEKMLRQMFGFNKGGKLGNVEAAFGGATIMNMINQLGASKGGKKAKGGSVQDGGKVRMADENGSAPSIPDPYASLRIDQPQGEAIPNASENTTPNSNETQVPRSGTRAGEETPIGANEPNRGNEQNGTSMPTQGTPNQSPNGMMNTPNQTSNGMNTSNSRENGDNNSQNSTTTGNQATFRRKNPEDSENNRTSNDGTSPIRFAQSEANRENEVNRENEASRANKASRANRTNQHAESRVNKNTKEQKDNNKMSLWQKAKQTKRKIDNVPTIKGIKNVTGGAEHVFKLAAKGTARAAGAIALGTIGLAAGISTGEIENAIAGAAGGMVAGNRVAKSITNRSSSSGSLRETFENGKYGEKEAKRRKAVREFKTSSKYQKLLDKFPEKEKEIDKFLNAGITDAGKIRIALQNSNNFSTDNAIAYMNMAKLCPSEIFEDRDKFNVYLQSHGIPTAKAQEIYNAVRKFK